MITERDASHAARLYDVRVTGLPNRILNNIAMEATLEQAGVEESSLGFVATAGQQCGEVCIGFSSIGAALRCVNHFNGCQWITGVVVTAVLSVVDVDSSATAVHNSCDEVWERRLNKRRDVVESVKATPEYQARGYTAMTPRPDDQRLSKRDWEYQVACWRRVIRDP